MKQLKMILGLSIILLTVAVLGACVITKQPSINYVEDGKNTYERESPLEMDYLAYIPLMDKEDIEGLFRRTNKWIKNHDTQYDLISVNVVNATVENDNSSYAHTMPSGVLIVYSPKR